MGEKRNSGAVVVALCVRGRGRCTLCQSPFLFIISIDFKSRFKNQICLPWESLFIHKNWNPLEVNTGISICNRRELCFIYINGVFPPKNILAINFIGPGFVAIVENRRGGDGCPTRGTVEELDERKKKERKKKHMPPLLSTLHHCCSLVSSTVALPPSSTNAVVDLANSIVHRHHPAVIRILVSILFSDWCSCQIFFSVVL
ncbi:hypothetical protein PIB30_079186 [Stylosanthes scabra]|uniref:Uncharacterized protein n=1 Tax=Stylosanthes scabra TaxID=79078 RepID=A0ABU6RS70_9FABA|nr:hypothetical protein [Stylosanthes scabra]